MDDKTMLELASKLADEVSERFIDTLRAQLAERNEAAEAYKGMYYEAN